MIIKKCFKCDLEKKISEFYQHKQMKDGHLNKCKSCTKKDSFNYVNKNENSKEKERERGRNKYHRLNYKEKKPDKESKKNVISNYKNSYREKYLAKNASIRIEKPKGFEKHHWSYNKEHWKDVIFLTVLEHNKLHRYLIYDKKLFYYRVKKDVAYFNKNDLLDTKEKHFNFFLETKNLK